MHSSDSNRSGTTREARMPKVFGVGGAGAAPVPGS